MKPKSAPAGKPLAQAAWLKADKAAPKAAKAAPKAAKAAPKADVNSAKSMKIEEISSTEESNWW